MHEKRNESTPSTKSHRHYHPLLLLLLLHQQLLHQQQRKNMKTTKIKGGDRTEDTRCLRKWKMCKIICSSACFICLFSQYSNERKWSFASINYDLNGAGRKCWLVTYLILLQHMLVLFMTSLIQTVATNWTTFFRDFRTSAFNKEQQKSSEKLSYKQN